MDSETISDSVTVEPLVEVEVTVTGLPKVMVVGGVVVGLGAGFWVQPTAATKISNARNLFIW
jgi:hypothetical protein